MAWHELANEESLESQLDNWLAEIESEGAQLSPDEYDMGGES